MNSNASNSDRVLALIGMSMKAGAVKSGEFACEQAIKDKSAKLCIVACDASDNTKKSYKDSCSFYNISYVEYGTKETLGHAIGKELRASVVICNEGLAKSICEKMSFQG
ncbi:MAG: ribosomal L7Ae/L30e/S12e/Gadd45 family protein [Pseudobutyrivibrio sp.]|nr:ribosomal L7Ae/L30e/S12e/Gadd45 family protein [Pseudobutyrivibrio sp.]